MLFKYFFKLNFYPPLLHSIFNLVIYALLSYLSEIIWGKNIPLPPREIMFYTTCIAIFFSPLILGQIAYFQKVMKSEVV